MRQNGTKSEEVFLNVTKIFSKKDCIFMQFYWTKVTKFVEVTKILSHIVLSDKILREYLYTQSFMKTGLLVCIELNSVKSNCTKNLTPSRTK